MAIKETKTSNTFLTIVSIITDTQMLGNLTPVIDTAGYDNGITLILGYQVTGGDVNFVITSLQQSENDNMSNSSNIESQNFIFNLSDLNQNSSIAIGNLAPSVGIIGNKRYIQIAYDLNFQSGTPNVAATLIMALNREQAPFDNPAV